DVDLGGGAIELRLDLPGLIVGRRLSGSGAPFPAAHGGGLGGVGGDLGVGLGLQRTDAPVDPVAGGAEGREPEQDAPQGAEPVGGNADGPAVLDGHGAILPSVRRPATLYL